MPCICPGRTQNTNVYQEKTCLMSHLLQYQLDHSSLFWENHVCELWITTEEESMKEVKCSKLHTFHNLGLGCLGSKLIDFASHFSLLWKAKQGTEQNHTYRAQIKSQTLCNVTSPVLLSLFLTTIRKCGFSQCPHPSPVLFCFLMNNDRSET